MASEQSQMEAEVAAPDDASSFGPGASSSVDLGSLRSAPLASIISGREGLDMHASIMSVTSISEARARQLAQPERTRRVA